MAPAMDPSDVPGSGGRPPSMKRPRFVDAARRAMAGIQEPDKVGTILNASIIGVNDNIRANTDKKTTAPTLYDLLTARLHFTQGPFTLFESDVSKANRRIKVAKGLEVYDGNDQAQVLGQYGGYLWGGIRPALLGPPGSNTHHLTPDLFWFLVSVDDFMALLEQSTAESASGLLTLFFTLLGCPISWHKNVLHPLNRWRGHQ